MCFHPQILFFVYRSSSNNFALYQAAILEELQEARRQQARAAQVQAEAVQHERSRGNEAAERTESSSNDEVEEAACGTPETPEGQGLQEQDGEFSSSSASDLPRRSSPRKLSKTVTSKGSKGSKARSNKSKSHGVAANDEDEDVEDAAPKIQSIKKPAQSTTFGRITPMKRKSLSTAKSPSTGKESSKYITRYLYSMCLARLGMHAAASVHNLVRQMLMKTHQSHVWSIIG